MPLRIFSATWLAERKTSQRFSFNHVSLMLASPAKP
jgi:hypothetical protein